MLMHVIQERTLAGATATGNTLVEGKLRSAVIHHLLGALRRSSWPPVARSFPSVLIITACLLPLFLEVDVGCFLGGGEI